MVHIKIRRRHNMNYDNLLETDRLILSTYLIPNIMAHTVEEIDPAISATIPSSAP